MKEGARRRIQFPVYEAETAFDDNVAGRLPGVDQTVVDFIKARHKYVGGQAANDVLLSLVALSNDDKHKTLSIIASAVLNVENEVTFTRCDLVSYSSPTTRPAVENDAVVTLLECRVTRPNPKVSMKLKPTFHIALGDGRGFGDVLADIHREVVEILNAPEILAAVVSTGHHPLPLSKG